MTTNVRRAVAATALAALFDAGQTTQWLAERTGITHRTLSRQLAGQVDFTVADLASIATALDISVAQLTPSLPISESSDIRIE